MTPPPRVLRLLATLLLAGMSCTSRERRTDRWPEDSTPVFSVSVTDSEDVAIPRDSVRRVASMPVAFTAMVAPDREHTQPVVVTVAEESKVLAVTPGSMRQMGDTVALLRRTGGPGGTWAATAPGAGWWRAQRYIGQSVWEGDTLGTIQSAGWYRAIGPVEDGGRTPARLGDSATIKLPGPEGQVVPGTVASVSIGGFGGTDVTVHFRARPDTVQPSTVVQVTVLPRESVLVVPARAVVSLSFGPAIFLPEGHGVFVVRFLVVDPHGSLGTVVHSGVDGPAPVAAGNLRLLGAAAEESLAVYRRRRR